MAVRIKNLGIVPDKDTVAMMDTPGSHVRTFEEIAQERGSVYVNRLVKDEQTSQLWLLDYQGFETSHVHSLGVCMTRQMAGREVAMASRPLKSKVSRAPLIFSEERTENTRQDAQLRKDWTLARSLASHGRTFVRNFGTTLENVLSDLVEKDFESRGIAQDCFFRDVFAGWTILLFSSGFSTLLSAMCVKFIEFKKIRKRLFNVDTYCLKIIGQVLEAEHMKFISNISGYAMGATPDDFEKKAKRTDGV